MFGRLSVGEKAQILGVVLVSCAKKRGSKWHLSLGCQVSLKYSVSCSLENICWLENIWKLWREIESLFVTESLSVSAQQPSTQAVSLHPSSRLPSRGGQSSVHLLGRDIVNTWVMDTLRIIVIHCHCSDTSEMSSHVLFPLVPGSLTIDIACVLRQLLSWFNLSFNRLKYFLIQSFNIFLSAPPVEMHRLSAVSGWLRKNNFQDCRVIKTPGKCFVHHTSKYKGKYLCSGNNHVIKHFNFHFLIFLLLSKIFLCACACSFARRWD